MRTKSTKKITIVGIFIITLLCSILSFSDSKVIATYLDNQKVTEDTLKKIVRDLPFSMRLKYVLGNNYNKLAEIYVIGKTLPKEEVKKLLDSESVKQKLSRFEKKLLLDQLYVKEIKNKISITDDEIKEYYEKHKDKYHLPERYKIQHIYISGYVLPNKEYIVKKGDTAESISKLFFGSPHYAKEILEVNKLKSNKELKPGMKIKVPNTEGSFDKKVKAPKEILEQRRIYAEYIHKLLLKGADFSEIAKKYSQVAGENKDRIIGPIPLPGSKKPILPEIQKTLHNMKEGEISPVIETKHGFEIFKLVKKIPEKTKTLDEVKESIKNKLFADKRRKKIDKYFEELKKEVVSNIDKLVKKKKFQPEDVIFQYKDFKYTIKDLKNDYKNINIDKYLSTEEKAKKFLEGKMIRKMLYIKAKEQNLDKTPEFTEKFEIFKNIVLGDEYIKSKVVEQSKITEEELKKYYEKNKEKFKVPAKYKIYQISIKVKNKKLDKERIESIYEKLKKGADFSKIAEEFSEDYYAKRGGLVGYLSEKARAPEFMKVVKHTKVGEISKPFYFNGYYYIIKVVDYKPEQVKKFLDVKDRIRKEILMNKQLALKPKLIKEYLKKINFKFVNQSPEKSEKKAKKMLK